jgi:hypothetical protein
MLLLLLLLLLLLFSELCHVQMHIQARDGLTKRFCTADGPSSEHRFEGDELAPEPGIHGRSCEPPLQRTLRLTPLSTTYMHQGNQLRCELLAMMLTLLLASDRAKQIESELRIAVPKFAVRAQQ